AAGGGKSIKMQGGTTTGGSAAFREGTNNGQNVVVFQAPASLSTDNTIEFTSTGLIPVSEISGAISGPVSSTNDSLVTFNGTDGTTLDSESLWTVSSGVLAGATGSKLELVTATTNGLSVTVNNTS